MSFPRSFDDAIANHCCCQCLSGYTLIGYIFFEQNLLKMRRHQISIAPTSAKTIHGSCNGLTAAFFHSKNVMFERRNHLRSLCLNGYFCALFFDMIRHGDAFLFLECPQYIVASCALMTLSLPGYITS